MRPMTLSLVGMAILLVSTAAAADDVIFEFDPPAGWSVTSISVRGSFNSWGETPMQMNDDGIWRVTLNLDPGEHTYKYFVNGQWPQDMETGLDGAPMDLGAHSYVDDGYGGKNAVLVVGGATGEAESFDEAPPLAEGIARLHYHRPHGGYGGWGLHVWEDTAESVAWTSPLEPAGRDEYGLYWDIRLTENARKVGFIIHRGDAKDPGPDMVLSIEKDGREGWLVSGRTEIYTEAPDVSALALGDLSRSQAHWLDRSTIAWRNRGEGHRYFLHSSPNASLELTSDGVKGGETLELEPGGRGLADELAARFPHLRGLATFHLPSDAAHFLRGQLAVSVIGPDGQLVDATGVQIPGVLDDLYAYDGPLGVTWDAGIPFFHVWAPTVQVVRLVLFDSAGAAEPAHILAMTEENGVWSTPGLPAWKGWYYLYEVAVYMPQTGSIELNRVTDPYSRGLAMNSTRSLIVDLDDPALKPAGWDEIEKPPLEAPEDIVLYELHIRDFSMSDETVPAQYRGTFKAFALVSTGTRHLAKLAEAGVSHVHLLPVFDIATINENRAERKHPGDLSAHGPDSEEQQAAIARIRDEDAYNWGYDPYHYGVPEGSYATDPNGAARIIEFREMVQGLAGRGLRTVMDVVYNHTHASGPEPKAVLDRIVPGYYHRLNADGRVETSTCCQNTATEHVMMERLMVDDLVHWARDYKVDGFRFDLMGHHLRRNMEKVRDALQALTPEADGVDGKSIYVYGEGWDFGEVQGGKRGVNATQQNMAGTGIGTFNDRLRDAVRGGSAFSDRREQGFATGLYTAPSGYNGAGPGERERLLNSADRIRCGLAGNLKDYSFIDRNGEQITADSFEGVAYASEPHEAIAYVSAHDNETLFDKVQYAAPASAGLGDRVRMQMLGISIVTMSQGVPFLHAGSELLRSKSMEADSYNAGDWFNRLDWTMSTNNFGVGLPSAEKNRDRWNIIRPLLAREELRPGHEEITTMLEHTKTMLRVRRSSPLFRLRSAEQVMGRVRFHNTGRDQRPGLIVMSISDEVERLPAIDPEYEEIVVLFNASPELVSVSGEQWEGKEFQLHPVLVEGSDKATASSSFARGEFIVSGRTTAVFVR